MNLLRFFTDRLADLAECDRHEEVINRPSKLSRRGLLAGGAALLSGALASRRVVAAPPLSSSRWLVNRLTMGWTPVEQQLVDTLGYHGYIDYHLNYNAIDDSDLATRLEPYWALNLIPLYLSWALADVIVTQTINITLIHAIYSKRQLFERMVEFWTDHFCIDITKGDNQNIKIVDDRDVIRANALGNFRTLLGASAHSPSMMQYLDNAESVAGNPNENYARELMELHTLGVSGGYTQQDVVEVARCFTGWGFDDSGTESALTFRYNPAVHDNDSKVVLGNNIPAGGGMQDAETVLDILAAHPSTANFIATKLCKRFYGYSPPSSLISSVAATFTSTNGDIKATMRSLLNSIDPATAPIKLKRPFHLFVSAMRASEAQFAGDPNAFWNYFRLNLKAAGHEPFFHGPPDGYPDTLEAWDGLLLPRWNFMSSMVNGLVDDTTVDIDALLGTAATAQQITDKFNEVIFGGTMTVNEQNAILNYLLPDSPSAQKKRDALALAMSTPTFQWY